MRIKDATLSNLADKLFRLEPVHSILIIKEESRLEAGDWLDNLTGQFPNAKITVSSLEKLPVQRYDLVIPSMPYDLRFSVKRGHEKNAIRFVKQYYVMYEDVYKTLRMARVGDLRYRLYIMPVAMFIYSVLAILFVVTPAYFFYPIVRLFSRQRTW